MRQRGVVESVILYYVIAGLLLFFVPNPISNSVGIGNRQNKIEKSDTTTLIYDKDGLPIAYRQQTNATDEQQSITFWEWLRSLPISVLFLMCMGVIFPPVAIVLAKVRSTWKSAFKNTYNGLKNLTDKTVICRKCGDTVTIDTKEHVFTGIELKQDKRDKVLQEKVRTELTK